MRKLAMATTTVLSDDTATIIQDQPSRFSWGPVFAGAVIATALTFFVVWVGSGLGLGLSSAKGASEGGIKAFLTLGAIYFVAANAFAFAVGGHVTGRLMRPEAEPSEEESFRSDAHGLAVWGLAVVFGLGVLALTAATTVSGGARSATTPAIYWADKLLQPSAQLSSLGAGAGAGAQGQVLTPEANSAGPSGPAATFADIKNEAARLLTVNAARGQNSDDSDRQELVRIVTQYVGLPAGSASGRVTSVENEMRAKAREAAETARRAASFISIWTATALLFSALVCVAATVSARWKDDRDMFSRSRHPNA
jgi:hypothetical protein